MAQPAGCRHARPAAAFSVGAATLALALAAPAAAQDSPRLGPSASSFGMPGMIDMPGAIAMPDGTLATTLSHAPGSSRITLSFQITPRLTGAFRYARVEQPADPVPVVYDRSFDLQFQITDEGRYMPAIAIGLRDFIGTGIYSSEYVVATRTLSPRMRVTGGIGWGRLATHGGFDNPLGILHDGFRTRPAGFSGSGGQPEFDRFFRGDAALFGGIEYQATDRLRLVAEYSSDAYLIETAAGSSWNRRTPLNFAASYQATESTTLTGYALHGGTVGLYATVALNPARPAHSGVALSAPQPLAPRPPRSDVAAWSESWAGSPSVQATLGDAARPLLQAEGLQMQGLEVSANRAVLRYANLRHEVQPRAIGRAARVLDRVLPASVEEFVLVPTVRGMAVSAITLRRSDLEELEFAADGAEALRTRARIDDAFGVEGVGSLWQPQPESVPRFTWSVGPYVQVGYFDPNSPVRADVGIRAQARYALAANVSVSGTVSQRLAGNISDFIFSPPTPGYPRVRTDAADYSSSSPVVDRLTYDHFLRPGTNLFGRVTVGYLERMYGGVSAELLWKPVDSRLALGAEVNWVRKRDPNSVFGFDAHRIGMGHVSAYYDFGNGFLGQVDAGRYLAGDWGATFRLEREFDNGWRVGAYATLTDMPFSVFGEGSFDKGITLSIPLTAFSGQPSRTVYSATIQSLTRDGGARLNVANRLYNGVRDLHEERLDNTWGSVWQ